MDEAQRAQLRTKLNSARTEVSARLRGAVDPGEIAALNDALV